MISVKDAAEAPGCVAAEESAELDTGAEEPPPQAAKDSIIAVAATSESKRFISIASSFC